MNHSLPSLPDDEFERIQELYSLKILDTENEEYYELLTKCVATVLKVDICLISLVDINRQWFKSCFGLDAKETSRSVSFCSHALHEKELLMIPDAKKDARFVNNPLVLGEPYIRFYCGAVLRGPTGKGIGTLCVIDKSPKKFNQKEIDLLLDFSKIIQSQIGRNEKLNRQYDLMSSSILIDYQSTLPNKTSCLKYIAEIRNLNDKAEFKVLSIRCNNWDAVSHRLKKNNIRLADHHQGIANLLRGVGELFFIEKNIFVLVVKPNAMPAVELLDLEHTVNKILHKDIAEKYNMKYSFSFGISTYPENNANPGILVEQSLFALGTLAPNEEGVFQKYSEKIIEKINYNYQLEHHLENSISNRELHLKFQPLVDAKSRKLVSFECLVRWHSKELGNISPQEFIPIAEKSNLIIKLEKWILEEACRQISSKADIMPVSINISPRHLIDKNFAHDLQKFLDKYKLDARHIKLEITEHTIINPQEIKEIIKECRKIGIESYLDDFGTGFSSIDALQELNITGIKIDKSFVNKMLTCNNTSSSIKMLIKMAKSAKILCVAEGVEDEIQAKFLEEHGCDILQGYYFGEPCSLEQNNQNNYPAKSSRSHNFSHEDKIVKDLFETGLIDQAINFIFEKICRLAKTLFDVPIIAINIIGKDQQWFKSSNGMSIAQGSTLSCKEIVEGPKVFIIEDARKDNEFCISSLVGGELPVIFYASCQISLDQDLPIGTLCIMDNKARSLSEEEIHCLEDLAAIVEIEIAKMRSDKKTDDLFHDLIIANADKITDSLTQVYNRRGIREKYDKHSVYAQSERLSFYFVIFDLDNLEIINDKYGHSIGDEILKNVAKIIAAGLGSNDYFGRVGGDEFVAIIQTNKVENIKPMLEGIIHSLNNAPIYQDIKVSLTIGALLCGCRDEYNFESALNEAYRLMYEGKRSGKNKYIINQ